MWAIHNVYHTVLKGNLYLCHCPKVTEELGHESDFVGNYHKMDCCKMESRMHVTFTLTAWTAVFIRSNTAENVK